MRRIRQGVRHSSLGRMATPAMTGPIVLMLLAACGSGGAASPSASPSPGGSSPVAERSPSATPGADPFAHLTYRLDLPAGWVVMGTDAYDVSIDAAPDVLDWLTQLDLLGPNAFRAYEPAPDAGGLRIAVNPSSTWNSPSSALQDAGIIAGLPGVSEEPTGDWVPIGGMAKGPRIRWTQTLDWGNGSPSSRICIGYGVLAGAYDPMNVVVSYPAETDRAAEVEALMASFEVTGNPLVSVPPGTTPSPSPTPFDKFASHEPAPAPHDAPELETLLPDSVEGVALQKLSIRGDLDGMTADNPILARFGKKPAEYEMATAWAVPELPLFIDIEHLRGVPAADLLAARLELTPDLEVSQVELGGHRVTYTGARTSLWYYASGEFLYGIMGLEDQVAAVFAMLP